MRHPSGLGRNVLQTLWLMRLSEWFLGERTSTKTVAEVNERIFDSSKLMAQTGIARRADVDEMFSDSEMALSQRAADLIEELDLRELKPGIGFLRSRHDEATKFSKRKADLNVAAQTLPEIQEFGDRQKNRKIRFSRHF